MCLVSGTVRVKSQESIQDMSEGSKEPTVIVENVEERSRSEIRNG